MLKQYEEIDLNQDTSDFGHIVRQALREIEGRQELEDAFRDLCAILGALHAGTQSDTVIRMLADTDLGIDTAVIIAAGDSVTAIGVESSDEEEAPADETVH